MKNMRTLIVLWVDLLLITATLMVIDTDYTVQASAGGTMVGFYNTSCPQAEGIVQTIIGQRFLQDKTITAALLRMLFHDSFVRGVDASIMLDQVPGGNETEKDAGPNLTLRGFDLIDAVKEALEARCPGVVSCADILVLAVRDCVALAGGPSYAVDTGRLDGKVSVKEEALNLPGPSFPIEQAAETFIEKGLTHDDMVTLLGAHTVGVALCGFFNDRIYNFHGTGMPDPAMSEKLLKKLTDVCPNPFSTESNVDPAVSLDQATPTVFDCSYYREILDGNGVLQLDQEIAGDPPSAALARTFTQPDAFFPAFAISVVKMGDIGVITGTDPAGEIRRKCNAVNSS